LRECVLDLLLGVELLETYGSKHVVLVGHSFGGAVVITGGAISNLVIGVAALNSQSAEAETVGELSPKPLLLIHGTAESTA
jgi:hypothetical protein